MNRLLSWMLARVRPKPARTAPWAPASFPTPHPWVTQVQSSEDINEIWEAHAVGATRELGVAGDALRTIKECERLFPCLRSVSLLGDFFYTKKLTDAIDSNVVDLERKLSDHRHVSRFGEGCRIGYSIEFGQNGYTLETIEGLDRSLKVLRYNNQVIRFQLTEIGRFESHQGMTYF